MCIVTHVWRLVKQSSIQNKFEEFDSNVHGSWSVRVEKRINDFGEETKSEQQIVRGKKDEIT